MGRPFPDVIREMSGGRTLDECTDNLSELVEQVLLCRQSGTFTLKITVKPNGENSVTMSDKVTITKPVEKRGDSIFFVKGGELLRDDPRQTQMPFRRVDGAAPAAIQPVKEIANG